MIEPRPGMMTYEKEEELSWYYMFIAACLSETEYKTLGAKWEQEGGYKTCPWWKFVKEHTCVSVSIKANFPKDGEGQI